MASSSATRARRTAAGTPACGASGYMVGPSGAPANPRLIAHSILAPRGCPPEHRQVRISKNARRHRILWRIPISVESWPMVESRAASSDIQRSRLFFGICLALIPTGASFALVSNILVPLKQQFILTNYQVGLIGGAALWGMEISLIVMGTMLEAFVLKNGVQLA